MYGNMNPGLLICRLSSEGSGNQIEDGLAQITWVEADATFGGRLQLYDKQGIAAVDVRAVSDRSGLAFVEFFWDPSHIGNLLSDSPQVRVSGSAQPGKEITDRGWVYDTKVERSFLTTRITSRMHICVNLGQVLKSGRGELQFKSPTKYSIEIAKKIKEWLEFRAKVANDKTPKFLKVLQVMRPSVEMYALLGAVDLSMTPYS